MTGRSKETEQRNELEALQAWQRDRQERDNLIFEQMEARRVLHQEIEQERQAAVQQAQELQQEAASYSQMGQSMEDMRAEFERVQAQIESKPAPAPDLNRPGQELER